MWIPKNIVLDGAKVKLMPLEETHIDVLVTLGQDGKIWEHYTIDGTDRQKLKSELYAAIDSSIKGDSYTFVIIDKESNEVIGSTRFLEINEAHKKLEIGWTWLNPKCWGTGINTECKLLLMTYCFEELGVLRVQYRTDELNLRSRKAIEKIGAKDEGVLRNDMLRDNGTNRNSAYYSIIDTEWSGVKQMLEQKIKTN